MTPPDRPLVALSTMWAVQPRFERDLLAFVERAAELGFEAVEVNHSMDAEHVAVLRPQRVLPVTAVHAPAPLERHASAGWNRELNLASTDNAERELVVEYTLRTIALAAELGARHVVVHLGGVGKRPLPAEGVLRGLYRSEGADGGRWARAVGEAKEQRAALAGPHLEQAQRSLDQLAKAAQEAGVTLGLECRLHYHEIPLPDEAATLLAPYPPEVAGYWHDVGHAEVQARLGYVDKRAWLDALGPRTLGAHLHDVDGIGDHRAPGHGDVEWDYIARGLPASALRVFEINQHEPDEAVAGAISFLRERGVVS